MLTLSLARAVYLVLGTAALVLAIGTLSGMTSAGARLDLPPIVGGVALGALLLGAAAFVTSSRPALALFVWFALVVVTVLAVLLVARTFASAADAILYAVVPVAVVLVATARLAVARGEAGIMGTSAVES